MSLQTNNFIREKPSVVSRFWGLLLERISSINALVYLENKTRYGTRKMGFVSALVLPFLTITMMYVIAAFIRHRQPGNMPLEVFILTGMVIWLTYQISMNIFIDIMRNSPSIHRHHYVVVPFDVTISKLIVAWSPLVIVTVFLVAGCMLLKIDMVLSNIPLAILCLLGAILMGCGLGVVFGVLSLFAEIFLSVKNVVNRAMFLVSGIFFSIDELPASVYAYVKYVPLVHLIEGLRFSVAHSYPAQTMQLPLAFGVILVGLFLAILLNTVRKLQKEM